jgi:hypothetical protein
MPLKTRRATSRIFYLMVTLIGFMLLLSFLARWNF